MKSKLETVEFEQFQNADRKITDMNDSNAKICVARSLQILTSML